MVTRPMCVARGSSPLHTTIINLNIVGTFRMKKGDYVKRKGESWHPLSSWYIEDFFGDRVYLVRREGCGMSTTTEDIANLELVDDYFDNLKKK